MRQQFLTLAALMAAGPATAAAITIEVPEVERVDRLQVVYDCGGTETAVEYFNAGSTSLAVFFRDGETIVASTVPSASGARYAGGRYIWWTKGDTADLYDALAGDDAKPLVSCRSKT